MRAQSRHRRGVRGADGRRRPGGRRRRRGVGPVLPTGSAPVHQCRHGAGCRTPRGGAPAAASLLRPDRNPARVVRPGFGPRRVPRLPRLLGPVHPRVLLRHPAKRRLTDQQGVLHDGAGDDRPRSPAHPAEHPAFHRDHAAGRARPRGRGLEAVGPYPAGACPGQAVAACRGRMGRGGVRHADQCRAPGARVGQLLRHDVTAGDAARGLAGRRGADRLHADLALCFVADRVARGPAVRGRRGRHRGTVSRGPRVRTAAGARGQRHRQYAGRGPAADRRHFRPGCAAVHDPARVPGLPGAARRRTGRPARGSPANGRPACSGGCAGAAAPSGPSTIWRRAWPGSGAERTSSFCSKRRCSTTSATGCPTAWRRTRRARGNSGCDDGPAGLRSEHRTVRLDDGLRHPESAPARPQPVRVLQLRRAGSVPAPIPDRRPDVGVLQPATAPHPPHATRAVRGTALSGR